MNGRSLKQSETLDKPKFIFFTFANNFVSLLQTD
jgi:hypothetical protein